MDALREQLLQERNKIVEKLKGNHDYIRLTHIDALLGSYESETVSTLNEVVVVDKLSFPAKASYLKQIGFIIKQAGRFLHNSEIYEEIKDYWSDLDEKDAKRRISRELSVAKREDIGGIKSYKFGTSKKDYVWGSEKWLNSNGEPLEEYKQQYKQKEKTGTIDLF